jgi:uncharacterized membrane protein
MLSPRTEDYMTPTARIVLLWLGFGATHIGLSTSAVRSRITARIGEPTFRALYSVVALGFFVPLVGTFLAHKQGGTWLWILQRGAALRWTMYVGIGLAFVLLLASFVRPSPASLVPGEATPHGVYHITRHPFSMALAIFGLPHLPATTASSVDAAFCGGLIVFAVLACWHQDRRELSLGVRGFREFYEATPFLPFTGRESLRGIRELSPIVVAVGIGATIVARYFQLGD